MSDTKGLPGTPFSARLTKEDVRYARRQNTQACVLARLLRRVAPDAVEVHAQYGYAGVRYPHSRWHFWTHDAGDLVEGFDTEGPSPAWVGRRVRFRPLKEGGWT
jgi:hypothetical protein